MRSDSTTLARRVATRCLISDAAFQVARGSKFAHDLTPQVLAAFGEGFLLDSLVRKQAGIRDVTRQLRRIWDFLRKAPKVWTKIKDFLEVQDISELPAKIKEFAKQGFKALGKIVGKIKQTFPMSLYFVPKHKMPGLTDLFQRLVDASPALRNALSKVNTNVIQPLDRWMQKYIPVLSRPIKAAIFIWVWLNVAEITWDFKALIEGFTGGISLSDLFASFPESGVGAVLAAFGVGYHLLPVMLMARILWLVASGLAEWIPNKGLKVDWAKIMGDRSFRPELVSL